MVLFRPILRVIAFPARFPPTVVPLPRIFVRFDIYHERLGRRFSRQF